ncbi:MAG: hypothetical protein NTW67_05525 [Candidatus Woesearchaeota archaeon]|nr:hypothetical protein [Candidatus Woesearchaeota archaeon]
MIYIDLDETIARTWHLHLYRRTKEGREYTAKNIDRLHTPAIHPALLEIAKKSTILTNAPQDYATALATKLGLNVPIIAAANKPLVTLSANSLVIGDEAKDVLTAHQNKLPSIGTAWGYSTKEQLEQAGATRTITKPEELPDLIIEFEKGNLRYQPIQPKFDFLPASEWRAPAPEITWKTLGTYYPVGDDKFDDFSGNILDYKKIKDHTPEEITKGKTLQFYSKGRIHSFVTCKDIVNKFLNKLKNEMPKSTAIPAPNSLPEYCYKIDTNRIMTYNLNEKRKTPRIIHREYPKQESHQGSRDIELHYATMSIENATIDTDITIFDDITTSGTQIEAIARLLRWKGHKGKVYALTIGKTRDAF